MDFLVVKNAPQTNRRNWRLPIADCQLLIADWSLYQQYTERGHCGTASGSDLVTSRTLRLHSAGRVAPEVTRSLPLAVPREPAHCYSRTVLDIDIQQHRG
jgi:hypothetical protein